MRIREAVGLTCALLLSSTASVYAYVDPGTGSYFFQLFIGFFLGGMYALKLRWRAILSWGRTLFKGKDGHGHGTS